MKISNKTYEVVMKDLDRLEQLEKAIKILKEHINISFYDEDCQIYIYEDEYCADFSCLIGFGKDEIDEYMLLKEVFEND